MNAFDAMNTTGWIIFIAALGTMFGLVGIDMSKLTNWSDAATPFFVGTTFVHLGAVIGAFVGGKMIQPTRDAGMKTRSTDPPQNPSSTPPTGSPKP